MLITGKNKLKEKDILEGVYHNVGRQVNLSYSFLRFEATQVSVLQRLTGPV